MVAVSISLISVSRIFCICDFERISTLDSILMQLAITEMTEFESIPYKVSINEYIEIAKIYSTQKSHEFINGILDAFLKKKILI